MPDHRRHGNSRDRITGLCRIGCSTLQAKRECGTSKADFVGSRISYTYLTTSMKIEVFLVACPCRLVAYSFPVSIKAGKLGLINVQNLIVSLPATTMYLSTVATVPKVVVDMLQCFYSRSGHFSRTPVGYHNIPPWFPTHYHTPQVKPNLPPLQTTGLPQAPETLLRIREVTDSPRLNLKRSSKGGSEHMAAAILGFRRRLCPGYWLLAPDGP